MQKNTKRHQQVLSRGKENALKTAVIRHSVKHEDKKYRNTDLIPVNRTHG